MAPSFCSFYYVYLIYSACAFSARMWLYRKRAKSTSNRMTRAETAMATITIAVLSLP